MQYPLPCLGPFAHLVLHGSGQQIDGILVRAYLPATTQCLVDLDQIGGNASLGGSQQVLLLCMRALPPSRVDQRLTADAWDPDLKPGGPDRRIRLLVVGPQHRIAGGQQRRQSDLSD